MSQEKINFNCKSSR